MQLSLSGRKERVKAGSRLLKAGRLTAVPRMETASPCKYSPDLNPIEQVFAKLKYLLRKAAARTVDTVCAAIGEILSTYTPTECANYFRNSGYQT